MPPKKKTKTGESQEKSTLFTWIGVSKSFFDYFSTSQGNGIKSNELTVKKRKLQRDDHYCMKCNKLLSRGNFSTKHLDVQILAIKMTKIMTLEKTFFGVTIT